MAAAINNQDIVMEQIFSGVLTHHCKGAWGFGNPEKTPKGPKGTGDLAIKGALYF